MPFKYALGKFAFEFHENRMGEDAIVTSLMFTPNNCPYFNSTEHADFIIGSNIQQYKVHLMIKSEIDLEAKVTDEGQWSKKKN